MPVGGLAVPRSNSVDTAVSMAIFNNEDELLKGAFRAFPKLKTSKDNAHSRIINSVAYNHDGTRIVSACNGGTIKVWDSGVSALTHPNPQPKTDRSCACGSIPGAPGEEAECAHHMREFCGLLPRWRDHRLGLL